MVRQIATDPRAASVLQPDFAKLDELAQLARGWDSYGAEPIAPDALVLAEALLIAVAAGGESRADGAIRPYVIVPVADGGVQIEWRGPGGLIEVEIGPDETIGYWLFRDGQAAVERDGAALAEARRAVIDVLRG